MYIVFIALQKIWFKVLRATHFSLSLVVLYLWDHKLRDLY